MTREWKVTLYRPYTSTEVVETFTEESLMNSYVKENEAYVVNVEEVVINNLTGSLNLGSGKTRYQVNVNIMYDDIVMVNSPPLFVHFPTAIRKQTGNI